MKKSIFFFLLAVVFVSCEGSDPIVIIDPPVEKFTITGIAGPNGKVDPKSQTVEKGGTASFKIIPDAGYEVDFIKDGDRMLPPVSIYTVKDLIENDTFEVSFKKDSILFPLINIIWQQDSTFMFFNEYWHYWGKDDVFETMNFNPDGTFSQLWNNKMYYGKWSLNKNSSPMILSLTGRYPFVVEFINEERISLHYTDLQGDITRYTYHNGGYK